jgi:hypothetical protein
LARGLQAILAREPHDAKEFARLVACRSSITDLRLALLARWMDLLDRRLGRLGSRLAALSGEVSGHEGALRVLCDMLRELDDPYGFGLGLDERIAGDASDRGSGEAEG